MAWAVTTWCSTPSSDRGCFDRLLARARTDRVEMDYVVLRPAPAAATQRAPGRPGHELTDLGPVAPMHREFSAVEPCETHLIDSSAMSPEETAEAVRRWVATGKMRVSLR